MTVKATSSEEATVRQTRVDLEVLGVVEGNPYGTGHVSGQGDIPISDTTTQAAQFQGNRVARLATAFKAGLAA